MTETARGAHRRLSGARRRRHPQCRQAPRDPRSPCAAWRGGDFGGRAWPRRARGNGDDLRRQRDPEGEGGGARPPACRALADDSGLCVEASRRPAGRLFRRWAGRGPKDFAGAMARVERELRERGVGPPWRASFRQRAGDLLAGRACREFRGAGRRRPRLPPAGDAGFGYDPIFRPDGHTRTFGQMSSDEKHGLPSDGSPALSIARAPSRSSPAPARSTRAPARAILSSERSRRERRAAAKARRPR